MSCIIPYIIVEMILSWNLRMCMVYNTHAYRSKYACATINLYCAAEVISMIEARGLSLSRLRVGPQT